MSVLKSMAQVGVFFFHISERNSSAYIDGQGLNGGNLVHFMYWVTSV